ASSVDDSEFLNDALSSAADPCIPILICIQRAAFNIKIYAVQNLLKCQLFAYYCKASKILIPQSLIILRGHKMIICGILHTVHIWFYNRLMNINIVDWQKNCCPECRHI